MALDGMLLHLLAKEIENEWLGSRVEKIHEPSKSELIVSLRGFGKAAKLLLSASGNAPRIHFTRFSPDNPQSPPMFCMLARKHLSGAKLTGVRKFGLERILMLDFEATNELMDKVKVTLCIEIMARYSNIILINEGGVIIDCIKRVDESTSSVRLVLPGLKYTLPPAQDKLDITELQNADRVMGALKQYSELPISKALSRVLLGCSAIVCRELAYGIDDKSIFDCNVQDILSYRIERLASAVKNESGTPVMLIKGEDGPFDISFTDIKQYGDTVTVKKYDTFSQLLDDFYYEKASFDRNKQRGTELIKLVKNLMERTAKKINFQKIDLQKCEGKEQSRIYGELISANLYRLSEQSSFYELQNFYDEACPTIRIKADPLLTPVQNAQKYFKEYKKACTAEIMLTQQIENGLVELQYLESVLDELMRAQSDRELSDIREELKSEGYIRDRKSVVGAKKSLPALKYISDDGFEILVGRNNIQNDKLTLKLSAKNDIWLHTKDIHGSHTVIVTHGREVPERTVLQGANLAAYHSSAKLSSSVPVDYTLVKFVKKPPKSKPGGVIYTNQKTVYVTPSKELENSLRVK